MREGWRWRDRGHAPPVARPIPRRGNCGDTLSRIHLLDESCKAYPAQRELRGQHDRDAQEDRHGRKTYPAERELRDHAVSDFGRRSGGRKTYPAERELGEHPPRHARDRLPGRSQDLSRRAGIEGSAILLRCSGRSRRKTYPASRELWGWLLLRGCRCATRRNRYPALRELRVALPSWALRPARNTYPAERELRGRAPPRHLPGCGTVARPIPPRGN